jgi:hypothetical protein
MAFTQTQRIEIAAGAIAANLKGRGYTGSRLDQAIAEVMSEMASYDTYGDGSKIGVATVREAWLADEDDAAAYRRIVRIRNLARKTVLSIDGSRA